MDEGEALALGKLEGVVAGLVVHIAREHHLGTVALGALDLDEGRGGGHNDTERAPARVAAKATPCAWLPALAVMMPRLSSSGVRVLIL